MIIRLYNSFSVLNIMRNDAKTFCALLNLTQFKIYHLMISQECRFLLFPNFPMKTRYTARISRKNSWRQRK
nr:MAG TPA: hypothetical protein [Caudoviricetes sp.]